MSSGGTNAIFEEVRKSASGAIDKAKLMISDSSSRSFGGGGGDGAAGAVDGSENNSETGDTESSDRLEELAEYCPKLTFQQRLIGFAVSFSMGYLIAFFSFRFFVELVEGYPLPFALNYTCGHILQLMASTFLCGPRRQFKNMFHDSRRMCAIVYLSCLGATFVVIFLPLPGVLKLIVLLLLSITQFSGSLWYSLSYIPYGRRTALRMLKNFLGIEDDSNSGGIASYTGIQLGGGQ